MKKFYQQEWQGIKFSSFVQLKANQVADKSFYDKFYQCLFERFTSLTDLPQAWLNSKSQVASFIAGRAPSGPILSIGCGLGVIEKALYENGLVELELVEISETPLKWVKDVIPLENRHIGYFPDVLTDENKQYKLIYLVAVEYVFDQQGWQNLLNSVYSKVSSGGRCLLVSVTTKSDKVRFSEKIKTGIKWVLHYLKLRRIGQLWGYLRTEEEQKEAFKQAGFEVVDSGYMNETHYFVEGKKK